MAKKAVQAKKVVQAKKAGKVRKKVMRNVPAGIVRVKATFNNTIIAITDPAGNVITKASAGMVGYVGSRKSSAFPATLAAQDAAKRAMGMVGLKEVEVNLKGPGSGRESAIRGLVSAGLIVTIIRDETPIPHNGCRPRKRRRV